MDDVISLLMLALKTDGLGFIGIILFLALLLRSAIGFGDGLLAVPLLTLFIELREAVPLILLLSTTVSFFTLWKNRRSLQLGSLKRTSIAALVGIPLGVLLLSFGNEGIAKGVLGILLVMMAAWQLLPSSNYRLEGEGWSYLFGCLAGMLGSAYALRGIVFSIYGNLRGWGPGEFKSTISGFYILSGVIIPLTYFGAGLITSRLLGLYLLLLPVAVIASVIGQQLTNRFDASTFQRIIWFFLLLFGFVLATRLVWGS
ncbi:sulfite exporter TauE/SafE family protein [Amphritea sp. 1_MG-2023]|uniref:sulfite exporter TauE/SafE family protein n=1 Tax=Amphritea sp. 1_MG-2023 TaxID=3062670 RepID=UPI0026E2B468|nr:sulfite exporter TauE/SafE family protein [Amphritea sp. 1_MG-2023]MDO6564377.1 sulfite exporter TauE/SafE family protein [Amphritea sp. 1_MG-2023]